MPPAACWPSGAVGEVCMDTTAIRMHAERSDESFSSSATVRRSRVEPAPGDAGETRSGDRRTRPHIAVKPTRFQAIPAGGGSIRQQIEWPEMRLRKGLKRYGLIAIAVPGLLLLTAISTLADASPSPSGAPSAAALPGDPTKGQAVYQATCTACHGTSLEGNIGPALNPIAHLPGVANPLDTTYLIDTISNGITPSSGPAMPAWKGKISDQDIKDAAAFIIQQNQLGGQNVPLAPGE